MSTRERNQNESERRATGAQPERPERGAGLVRERIDSIRQTTQELLATGRNVINSILSGESEDFLEAVRQEGGQ